MHTASNNSKCIWNWIKWIAGWFLCAYAVDVAVVVVGVVCRFNSFILMTRFVNFLCAIIVNGRKLDRTFYYIIFWTLPVTFFPNKFLISPVFSINNSITNSIVLHFFLFVYFFSSASTSIRQYLIISYQFSLDVCKFNVFQL